ncbi:MAG TPA: tetratricopeptide repeat protein, partial [Gammaproteobacteria bacterium]|nr:tetratricopeptide repeat protein [Gammaproteobacteria bacterium]
MSNQTNAPSVLIEENKRLSESALWRMQREYFDKESINAWVNQVPFYITSNPFIAHCYAQIVLNFMVDWTEQHPEAKQHPFYILEPGTGSGRFSFFVIKTLLELIESLNLTDLRFCYVMSDVTRNNINYYEKHPALQPYLEKGLIDFAIYNMESDKPITLLRQHIHLDQKTLQNPLIVFANYIFDTISHDAFTVHDKKLYELLISLKTETGNLQGNRPVNLDKLETVYHIREIKSDYYPDPVLNEALAQYKAELHETSLLFPIGSFRAIQYLRKISNDKLLIISTDKGYSTLQSLDYHGHPSLSFHGSFSMMVNYHALDHYFKNTGGDAFLQTSRKGIKTSVFCAGLKLRDLPRTHLAVEQYVEGFSPGDYFTLHRRVSDSFNECDLDTIAAHMHLTRWDPHMYLKIKNRIMSLVANGEAETLEFMAANMPKLAANFYHLPKTECVLFEIGVFYHAIKKYAEALSYYEQSLPYIGEQFSLRYNIALCQHQTGKNEEALASFKKALELNSESKETE